MDALHTPNRTTIRLRWLADVIAWIEDNTGSTRLPASLMGHSMGGKVAMLVACLRPDLVSRLYRSGHRPGRLSTRPDRHGCASYRRSGPRFRKPPRRRRTVARLAFDDQGDAPVSAHQPSPAIETQPLRPEYRSGQSPSTSFDRDIVKRVFVNPLRHREDRLHFPALPCSLHLGAETQTTSTSSGFRSKPSDLLSEQPTWTSARRAQDTTSTPTAATHFFDRGRRRGGAELGLATGSYRRPTGSYASRRSATGSGRS